MANHLKLKLSGYTEGGGWILLWSDICFPCKSDLLTEGMGSKTKCQGSDFLSFFIGSDVRHNNMCSQAQKIMIFYHISPLSGSACRIALHKTVRYLCFFV